MPLRGQRSLIRVVVPGDRTGHAKGERVSAAMKERAWFVSECYVEGGGQMKLMGEEELGSFSRFNTRCADVEQAFTKFRQLQTEGDGSVPHADKQELQKKTQGVGRRTQPTSCGGMRVKIGDKTAYAKWVKSHQPFHWFIQFLRAL